MAENFLNQKNVIDNQLQELEFQNAVMYLSGGSFKGTQARLNP